ncbi:hypothetical protein [Actinomadura litoris]|uniref:Hemerythrin domain-containing protein n=1 Tax=Actinomadura litoris TaxID=2678616 RepID=A0A7K1L585_9ACTN|nr:hypothetical protein [Actinomadura litoris]MUN39578.1 hypothetical protein [Actinomadura litoris]
MSTGVDDSARRRFDLTMLHAAYGAFRRDMAAMAVAGRVASWGPFTAEMGPFPVDANAWSLFRFHWLAQQAAERRALWTVIRGRVTGGRSAALDAMDVEAVRLVALMDRVDAALEHEDDDILLPLTRDLPAAVEAYLDFKEANVLPLIHENLTPYEWGTYDVEFRQEIGVRGLRVFLPWLLDGASEATCGAVLRLLPPPVRLAYRTRWLPRYRRALRR